jgi:hypothetical protein
VHACAQSAAVNLLAGAAEVTYDPDATGPRHIIAAVQDAGFEAHLLSSSRCARSTSCTCCVHNSAHV